MKKLYAIVTLLAGIGMTTAASAQCTVSFTYTTNGLTINATATGVGQAAIPSYGFDWGDSQFSVSQTASHTYAMAGTYTVCAYYIDALDTANCSAQSCQQVTVTSTAIAENGTLNIEAGAFPNPFTGKTNIRFTTTQASEVEIVIYDVLGNKVSNLLKENIGAGEHNIDWNAESIPAGVYFMQVKAGNITLNKKIMKNQ